MELKLEVSYCTTNLEEDRTEVLHQEEAMSNQPVPEGTVVSTVMSGILFACFPTVDYVTQL